MLANSLIAEIRRLLGEGKLSQRKIARTLRVSRGVVNAVAAGRRPDLGWPGREDPGLPKRCPTCGGMVYLPCQLCRIRALAAVATRRRRNGAGPSGLQLKDEHRRRYELVCARKLLEKEAV
jgi:hypothetical protein